MSRMVAGIDEAGRGPVIGPMVIACCTIKEEDEIFLKTLGVKDSKLLSLKQREELYDVVIKKVISYNIKILPPEEIDNALNDPNLNLNALEANTSAILLNSLAFDKVTLDCPSTNIKAYAEFVKKQLKNKKSVEVVAEHKADFNHPIVSAASILAKVTRDREIQKLKDKFEVNFGSGYPSDPLTQEFLEKNYDKYPEIFRKTWASYQNILKKKSQKSLFDY